MGLLTRAYETYYAIRGLGGDDVDNSPKLTPLFHVSVNAKIEITLDSEGKLKKASLLDDGEDIFVPATKESFSRSGQDSARPLSDELQYLAPYGAKKYDNYIKALEDWVDSDYGHDLKLKVVLNYVRGKTILEDLSEKWGVIKLDDSGLPEEKYNKYIVRWRVYGESNTAECWNDENLWNDYERYYREKLNREEKKGLCMLTGKKEAIGETFPYGISKLYPRAKLISSNDKVNFTYRGRFDKPQQACTLGYESYLKAHYALQWLIRSANHHANIGSGESVRTFICWNPNAKLVPQILNDDPYDMEVESALAYGQKLKREFDGYRQNFLDSEDVEEVIIAALDPAPKGRLSITYYNELKARDFFIRLDSWYKTCRLHTSRWGELSPPLKQIVYCAYGSEKKNKESENGRIEVSDKILKEQVQILLRCILDEAPIPQNFVVALAQRASMPLAYSYYNRQKVLFTACAVIRKYRNDKRGKEEFAMILEPHKKDNSYQYGRLLAVLEKVERDTYEQDERREPNAIRMQTVFRERPQYAFNIIHERLEPYFQRLNPGLRIYYKGLIGEIVSEFEDDGTLNRPLADTYLLGYYLQRKELYTKKAQDDGQSVESEQE